MLVGPLDKKCLAVDVRLNYIESKKRHPAGFEGRKKEAVNYFCEII